MLNKHYKQKAAQLFTRAGISMDDDDIHLKDFYEWLDTYPNDVIKWEVTEVFEGVRYVRFIVREDEDEWHQKHVPTVIPNLTG